MLDDIDITLQQMGDQSCGMHIPGTDVADNRRSAGATSGPGMGKEKIAPSGSASKVGSWSASKDLETSTEEIAPLGRKRRLVRSDGSVVLGQQAPKKATTLQSNLKVAASMVSGMSGGGESITTVKEGTTATAVAALKKAAVAAVPREDVAAKKATKVAVEEALAMKTAEAVAAKMMVDEAMATTMAAEDATIKTVVEEDA
jgi:hypothetical protein